MRKTIYGEATFQDPLNISNLETRRYDWAKRRQGRKEKGSDFNFIGTSRVKMIWKIGVIEKFTKIQAVKKIDKEL